MRSCVWTALLRRIPPEHHNILMLVTRCGTEIALQDILHVDDELLAIKGRLAGSQDAGRLYFVPLDNIDYFGFNRIVQDAEFAAMFGDLHVPAETVAPPTPPAPQVVVPLAPSNHDTPPPEPKPPETAPPTATPLPKATPQIKSAVLERFRARGLGPTMNGTGLKPD